MLYTVRTNYSFTTNMSLRRWRNDPRSQSQFNANFRFNLIHHPLSDLFIVLNEQKISLRMRLHRIWRDREVHTDASLLGRGKAVEERAEPFPRRMPPGDNASLSQQVRRITRTGN
ncbi:MAG: hypothetical protein IPP90_21255 [Gemmatimonadaceae bacterium]|nr:hypothetical protein [Gemmatimonadaceae bacterium]